MLVLTVPRRLRFAASTLFLSILWVALEVVVEARAPWWHLPYDSILYWSVAFSFICFPLYSWIIAGKRWAFTFLVGGAVFWIIATASLSIQTKNPSLGFFTLFLIVYFLCELLWLRFELNKSFFDPKIHWYQSLPKPIHGLECQLLTSEFASFPCRVSRFDTEGAFIYTSTKGLQVPVAVSQNQNQTRTSVNLVFKFHGQKVECRGLPILAFGNGKGVGLQFVEMTSDQEKNIGDFAEKLRVQGLL